MSQNKEAIQWRNQIVNLFSVFIGVYIAFALNKYQANNNQARLQKQYLTSLKNDLVKDLDLIQTDILQLDTLKYKNTRLISYSQDQFDPSDSLNYFITGIMVQTIFHPNNFTFLSLLHSGDLTHFADVDFIRDLTELYNGQYASIQELDAIGVKSMQDQLVPLLIQGSGLTDKTMKGASFTNLVTVFQSWNDQKQRTYYKAKNLIEKILPEIDRKL
ncbi:MAG: hypothetical protein IPP04_16685 [Saprospiraceae bacterium]|nr:hypothetical protein [Saprospiraceae bacterium]